MQIGIKMLKFIHAYIRSMRLYYSFVTGIAGWIGVSFYIYIAQNFATIEKIPSVEKKGIILVLLFLSWGINQIINDFLGRKEDRINAPDRPMVNGELNAKAAIFVSLILLAGTAFLIWFYLEPIALIPFFAGILLNVIYEHSKGYGIWGNIIFGLMITMCTVFGFLAAGPTEAPYFTSSRNSVLAMIWIMNGLMTFYTYFKDYKGDKAANKQTIIVKYGVERSKIFAIIGAFLPSIIFIILYSNNFIEAKLNNIFLILGTLTVFLQI